MAKSFYIWQTVSKKAKFGRFKRPIWQPFSFYLQKRASYNLTYIRGKKIHKNNNNNENDLTSPQTAYFNVKKEGERENLIDGALEVKVKILLMDNFKNNLDRKWRWKCIKLKDICILEDKRNLLYFDWHDTFMGWW